MAAIVLYREVLGFVGGFVFNVMMFEAALPHRSLASRGVWGVGDPPRKRGFGGNPRKVGGRGATKRAKPKASPREARRPPCSHETISGLAPAWFFLGELRSPKPPFYFQLLSLKYLAKKNHFHYPHKWRGGRVVEGAPLLREYACYSASRVRIPSSPPCEKFAMREIRHAARLLLPTNNLSALNINIPIRMINILPLIPALPHRYVQIVRQAPTADQSLLAHA